jgi:PD-(D/E)XK nuclease superfamily
MTDLALAPAGAPTHGATTAAALAARIEVPRRLPPRLDGEPIRHLSHSSYSLWLACPEAWRLRYLQQRKEPTSGAMFLGSRVDDALSLYYRTILEHGERLDTAQVKDAYRDLWHTELQAEEEEKLGVDWQDIHQHAAFELGLQALELTFEQLVPKLGEPLAVQRRLEFALAPGATEWTIVCYLDLETRASALSGEPIDRVVDYKVKGSLIGQTTADRDLQASLYLAGRWLEGRPAAQFAFAQIGKPGRQRRQISAALTTTRRTPGQLRASLARIALAAAEIDAYYRHFGPHRPWGLADPTSWKCSARFCSAWASCPGGAGL